MRSVHYISCDEQTGYGTAAAGLITALKAAGIRVEQTLIRSGRVNRGGILVREERFPARASAEAVIIHTVPEYYPYWLEKTSRTHPHAPVWGYTAWETDRIPPHWAGLLNRLHGVFVPSQWNREVLLACGVEVPVVVLPHVSEFGGATPHTAPSHDLQKVLAEAEGRFLFYSIGMWNERKNQPLLIEAFREEFHQDEKAVLLLKTDALDWTTCRRSWKKLFLRPTFDSSSSSLKKLTEAQPEGGRILHVTKEWCAGDLAWLHQQGDCFVSCTRGEGWGMGAYEAAWYGKAVVMTSHGGQLDYLSPEDAYLLPFQLERVATAFGKGSYTQEQQWAAVDKQEVRKVLRAIYQDPSRAKHKGGQLRDKVSRAFHPERIANTCIEVLFP
ncbi:glycosyltransferase family 4 protein [Paenibacillus sp. F411]|uniref:glycosyltransferase family 4 protein n=1 Tax=Paenibacillus sp. F411 TaxID=2820239 RepID=UPI001AAE5CBE|nr:glycosyltransferase family 4 protein [Paenibacillus sp. F411]MBO2944553.1 glycosyltransferase family 4 protein [Paenibacillus sp. F411]